MAFEKINIFNLVCIIIYYMNFKCLRSELHNMSAIKKKKIASKYSYN